MPATGWPIFSTKVHCPHCTTRTRGDGTTSYHHAGLAAVLIHPAHEEVFPLDFEPILNQDGDKKKDKVIAISDNQGYVLSPLTTSAGRPI